MLRSIANKVARPVFARRAFQPAAQTASFHASAPSRSNQDEVVEPGFIDKYQLYEPSRYVPLGVGIFGTLSATGLYHWNEESQLLGLFLLFVGTVYSKGGDAIGKMLDEVGDQILKEHNALEDQLIDVLRSTKALQVESLDNYNEAIALYKDYQSLITKLAEVQPALTTLQVHQQVEKMMQMYVAQESNLTQQAERLVVDSAADAVKQAFLQDAKLQSAAMTSAFDSLANPDAKSNDVVGELFVQFFQEYRKAAWEDRVNNSTVSVSAKVKDDTEALKKQLAAMVGEAGNADVLFPSVGDKFDFAKDGLDGAVFTDKIENDTRFKVADADNKKFLDKSAYEAWKSESLKLAPKEI